MRPTSGPAAGTFGLRGFWRALLAFTLLVLPVADLHAENTLAPVAPGSLVATDAIHPGAATHFEASATRTVPRCPACDLAQQSAAALTQVAHVDFALRLGAAPLLEQRARPATPLALAPNRGPPQR